jgi:hypothetical protein
MLKHLKQIIQNAIELMHYIDTDKAQDLANRLETTLNTPQ